MNAGHRRRVVAIAGLFSLALALAGGAALAAEDSLPGLALVATDGSVTVRRSGASPALFLDAGESLHPALDPERTTIALEGLLAIESADRYRFRAVVQGAFRLDTEGAPALSLVATDATVETPEPGVALEPSLVPIRLTLSPSIAGAPRRLRLEWRSTRFDWEPVPLAALRHDAAKAGGAERARLDRGRRLADDAGCVNCHAPAGLPALEALVSKRGAPDLSRVGSHARPEWIARWLARPAAVRPGTPMPRLFADGAAADRERASIALFLAARDEATRTGPPPRASSGSGAALDDAAAGETLFFATGCVACHDPIDRAFERSRPAVSIAGSGSRSTPAGWAHYLLDPLRHDPSGRMPDLSLSPENARRIAAYLATSRDASLEAPLASGASADEGARLVRERSCVACHALEGVGEIAPPGRPLAELDLAAERGCLSPSAPDGRSPRYDLPAGDLAAIREFLASPEARASKAAPAPIEISRARMDRLRCDACHAQAGAESELSRLIAQAGGEAPREAMQPPSLAGAGAKLRGDWLAKVLAGDGRARPWLALRMPKFGAANAEALAPGLLARDGFCARDDEAIEPPPPARVLAGRDLLSPQRLSCTSCHDMAGVPGSGSRGPEVLRFTERLRREWFARWMLAPQRLKPATEMPTYFAGGKSLVGDVEGGDAHRQIGALFAYLTLGMNAPLPDGLTAPSGISLAPKDRPLVVRTPLGDRARVIAVGFPGGVSAGVDAGDEPGVRLLWDGGFLRANGTQWTGQHGPYPEIEGRLLADFPNGFAWSVGTETVGPARFRGYHVEKAGTPVFDYDLPLGSGVVRVTERLAQVSAGPAAGIERDVTLAPLPRDRAIDGLLFAHESGLAVLDSTGVTLGPGSRVEVARSPFVEVIFAGGRRAFVVARSAPPKAAFVVGESPLAVRLLVPPSPADSARIDFETLFAADSDVAATRIALEASR